MQHKKTVKTYAYQMCEQQLADTDVLISQ